MFFNENDQKWEWNDGFSPFNNVVNTIRRRLDVARFSEQSAKRLFPFLNPALYSYLFSFFFLTCWPFYCCHLSLCFSFASILLSVIRRSVFCL